MRQRKLNKEGMRVSAVDSINVCEINFSTCWKESLDMRIWRNRPAGKLQRRLSHSSATEISARVLQERKHFWRIFTESRCPFVDVLLDWTAQTKLIKQVKVKRLKFAVILCSHLQCLVQPGAKCLTFKTWNLSSTVWSDCSHFLSSHISWFYAGQSFLLHTDSF